MAKIITYKCDTCQIEKKDGESWYELDRKLDDDTQRWDFCSVEHLNEWIAGTINTGRREQWMICHD